MNIKKEESLDETKSAWMSLGKKAQDIDNGLQKNVFGNKKWKKLRPRRELFKLKKFKELAMP